MNGGDDWSVIRYPGGSQDKTIINRFMLRFRPIAPKPVTDGSSSGSWKPENKNCLITDVRKKRKYVRAKKSNEYYKRRKKRKSSSSNPLRRDDDSKKKLLTLQLLPERTDLQRSNGGVELAVNNDCVQGKTDKHPPLLSDVSCVSRTDRTAPKRIVETWVTVESVTDTCMEVIGRLGSTDVERMKNLEEDTCPGFISDGSNTVWWVNGAYRKMMRVRDEDITVGLVTKEKLLPYLYYYPYPAFTCWVKLQYTWHKQKFRQMVPCDVWRMEFGGFAWRMDIKAALSLGI